MLFHPRDRALYEFTDHELRPGPRRRVARHLAKCDRCRRVVREVQTLSHSASTAGAASPSAHLKFQVIESIVRGEAVIIPLVDPVRVVDPVRAGFPALRVASVTALGLLLVLGVLQVLGPPVLQSDASSLLITPRTPNIGAELALTYHAIGLLATEDSLRVRAMYRTSGQRFVNTDPVQAGVLTRTSRSTYSGSVQLPPNVVFALLTIEDFGGATIDGNAAFGWEVVTHENGRPRFDAVWQLALSAPPHPVRTREISAMFVDLFPDSVQSWVLRRMLDKYLTPLHMQDSMMAFHADQFRRLEDLLELVGPSGEDAAWLGFYSWSIGRLDRRDAWNAKVPRWPTTFQALQTQAVRLVTQAYSDDPDVVNAAFDSLEVMWEVAGDRGGVVSGFTFPQALHNGDDEAVLRWARRLAKENPARRVGIALDLSRRESLADTARVWLSREADRLALPDDARRPLHRTARKHAVMERERHLRLVGRLGKMFVENGDLSRGLPMMDSADTGIWDVNAMREHAAVRLAAGDSTGAAWLFARLSVDPVVDSAQHYGELGKELVSSDAWTDVVQNARGEMFTISMLHAANHMLTVPMIIRTETGEEFDLGPAMMDQITVIAERSDTCAERCWIETKVVADLLARDLETFEFVILMHGTPTDLWIKRMREAGITAPMYTEANRGLHLSIGMQGPVGGDVFLVFDTDARLQFTARAVEVPRFVRVLREIAAERARTVVDR